MVPNGASTKRWNSASFQMNFLASKRGRGTYVKGRSMAPTPSRIHEFLRLLSDLGVRYHVGGSFASSAWGEPRQTNDLDIAVVMSRADIERLYEIVKEDYMCSFDEMIWALSATTDFPCFQLMHTDATFKVDVFVLPASEYTEATLSRARPFRIASDFEAPFACPEDTVITKLRWFELGNRVSDKQWNDIVGVLEMQSGDLDEDYLNRWTQHFGLKELLDKARSQVTPP